MSSLKSRVSSVWSFIKRKKYVLIGAIVLILVLIIGAKLRSNGAIETTTPTVSSLVRTVRIAGKVTPKESVSLGFETAGIVSSISKNVGDVVRRGDVIARLDTSTLSTDIQRAEADLSLAQANLEKLGGTGVFEAQIDNSKRTLIQTLLDAYTTSEDAVHNKTDQIFIDPRASRPEIIYAFSNSYNLRDSIVNTRSALDEKLDDWETLITGLSTSNYNDEHLSKSKQYLRDVSTYINNVAQAVNLFESSSSISQDDIDTYKADAKTARDGVSGANQDLITAEDNFKGLLLEMPAQVARVESARATLSSERSRLSKTVLTSPINGIVSRQDAKVGQVASVATDMVSVISTDLEVEAFIPEILISGVEVGNIAMITLDAYGESELFEARVVHLDPAETIRDGVSTYKVRIAFSVPDTRVRPGMTANIGIETFRKDDSTIIPERAVIREMDQSYVYILSEGAKQEKVPVEVGERDSSGNIELISGISSDTQIIINPVNP